MTYAMPRDPSTGNLSNSGTIGNDMFHAEITTVPQRLRALRCLRQGREAAASVYDFTRPVAATA